MDWTAILAKAGAVFPRCPLCGETGTFKILKGNHLLACQACKAQWSSPQILGDDPLTDLKLQRWSKADKASRSLWMKAKTVGYWQVYRDDPRPREAAAEVSGLLERLAALFPERDRDPRFGEAMATAERLSPLARAELEGIAAGVDGSGIHFLALWVITRLGSHRWVELLAREMTHPDEKRRQNAVLAAMELTGETGDDALVPAVLERLAHDESGAVRIAAAGTLHRAGPDPAVIAALKAAGDDHARAKEVVMAGSWAGFVSEVLRQANEPTVAQAAAGSLALLRAGG
jgi:hypothetical protein